MNIAILLGIVLVLMWLVMAAPIGLRTIQRRFDVDADIDHVRSALHPFGDNYTWNNAVSAVKRHDDNSGHVVTTHTDRAGGFIEREFAVDDAADGLSWTMRFTNDSSLAQNFWADHQMVTQLRAVDDGKTEVTVCETDRYRGIAFYVFRFFSMRRSAEKLKIWAREGTFRPGGLFEKPSTQFAMAVLSALLLWPFFGLTANGLMLASILTAIVGLHELGHIVAFRLMGHKKARMIFIPILGGIAMGGRPYDKHFEIGFSALMGAGFSAFLMALVMGGYQFFASAFDQNNAQYVVIFVLIGGLFNIGNLVPVWKFDGGQVLRQVFRSRIGLSVGAFVLLSWFVVVGLALGIATQTMLIVGCVFAVLSVMTSNGGIKPKNPLTPMTGKERLAILAAFAATFSVHSFALIWSANLLFV